MPTRNIALKFAAVINPGFIAVCLYLAGGPAFAGETTPLEGGTAPKVEGGATLPEGGATPQIEGGTTLQIEGGASPKVEVHGFNEIYYHVHDLNRLSFESNGTRGDGFYIGLSKLTFRPHFNPHMDGFFELFLFPKDSGANYVKQMDVVGNGATQFDLNLPAETKVADATGSTIFPFPSISTLGLNAGRMQVSFMDVFGPGNIFSLGQIRVPFGNWDEFSVHRNFVSMKSDARTLGFMLRRIDLGAAFDGEFAQTPLVYRFGLINRSDSSTANNTNLVDWTGRLGLRGDWGEISLNGYLADRSGKLMDGKPAFADRSASGKRYGLDFGAYGLDLSLPFLDSFNLLGEVVHQERAGVHSNGLYSRLNYDVADLLPGLRLYTGIDWLNYLGPDVKLPNGPRNLQDLLLKKTRIYDQRPDGTSGGLTWAAGARYRFLPGATIGVDYFYGQPMYPDGHVHLRLETSF